MPRRNCPPMPAPFSQPPPLLLFPSLLLYLLLLLPHHQVAHCAVPAAATTTATATTAETAHHLCTLLLAAAPSVPPAPAKNILHLALLYTPAFRYPLLRARQPHALTRLNVSVSHSVVAHAIRLHLTIRPLNLSSPLLVSATHPKHVAHSCTLALAPPLLATAVAASTATAAPTAPAVTAAPATSVASAPAPASAPPPAPDKGGGASPVVLAVALHTAMLDPAQPHNISFLIAHVPPSASPRHAPQLRLNLTLPSGERVELLHTGHRVLTPVLSVADFAIPAGMSSLTSRPAHLLWHLEFWDWTIGSERIVADLTQFALPFVPHPRLDTLLPGVVRVRPAGNVLLRLAGFFPPGCVAQLNDISNTTATTRRTTLRTRFRTSSLLVVELPSSSLQRRAGLVYSISVTLSGLWSAQLPLNVSAANAEPALRLAFRGGALTTVALTPALCNASTPTLQLFPPVSAVLRDATRDSLPRIADAAPGAQLVFPTVERRPRVVVLEVAGEHRVLLVHRTGRDVLPLDLTTRRSADAHAIFKASVSPPACIPPDTRLRFRWRVVRAGHEDGGDDEDVVAADKGNAQFGETAGMATATARSTSQFYVATRGAITVAVSVTAVDELGVKIASASAVTSLPRALVHNAVSVNGRLSATELPTGGTLRLVAALAPVFGQQRRATFVWACTGCPRALAPPSEPANSISLSAKGVDADVKMRYKVTAWSTVGRWLGSAGLLVRVAAAKAVRFPRANFTSSARPGVPDPRRHFECAEQLTLAWVRGGPVNFTLRAVASRVDVLSRAIVSRPGHWDAERAPSSPLLTLNASMLQPGEYVLRGQLRDVQVPARSEWAFSIKPCPKLAIPPPPVVTGVVGETVFRVSALVQGDGDESHVVRFLLDPPAFEPQCVSGCDGSSTATFTVPRAGTFRIVAQLFDASGYRLLATARAPDPPLIVSAPASDRSLAPMPRLHLALRGPDDAEVISALLAMPKGTELPPALSSSAVRALSNAAHRPGQPVFRAVAVVTAARKLMGAIGRSSSVGKGEKSLLGSVESAVTTSLSGGASGASLHSPLAEFYATAASTTGNNLTNVRTSAGLTIPLALAAGLPCGTTARVRVALRPGVEDDFRAGTDCYRGQIRSLPPKPPLFARCANDSNSAASPEGPPTIVLAVARAEMATSSEKLLRSASVHTRFAQLSETNGESTLSDTGVDAAGCFVTPLSIAQASIAGRSEGAGVVSCPKAGALLESGSDANTPMKRAELPTLTMDGGGTASATISRDRAGGVQLEVNASALAGCANLALDGSSGSAVSATVAAVSVGVAVAVVLAIVVVVAVTRGRCDRVDRFSVPESAAPLAGSTSLSLANSVVSSQASADRDDEYAGVNEWEREYASIRPGGMAEIDEEPLPLSFGETSESASVTGDDASDSVSVTMSGDSMMNLVYQPDEDADADADGNSGEGRGAGSMRSDVDRSKYFVLADEFGRKNVSLPRKYGLSHGGIALDRGVQCGRQS